MSFGKHGKLPKSASVRIPATLRLKFMIYQSLFLNAPRALKHSAPSQVRGKNNDKRCPVCTVVQEFTLDKVHARSNFLRVERLFFRRLVAWPEETHIREKGHVGGCRSQTPPMCKEPINCKQQEMLTMQTFVAQPHSVL